MKTRKIYFTIILLLSLIAAQGQEVTGIIIDIGTNLPVEGASVYFDNTTVGTTTNQQGKFSISLKNKIQSPLVISFLGYETYIVTESIYEKPLRIFIKEDVSALEEVFIDFKDEWSKKRKLKEFRRHFLGFSKFSKSCTIINEDDLVLRFSSKDKSLTASSTTPIRIKNEALDYEIIYNLEDFSIDYEQMNIDVNGKVKKRFSAKSVTIIGTSFFKDIVSNKHKKALKNREKAYQGSVLHFMRSITKNELTKERFKIYRGEIHVNPEDEIFIRKNDSLNLTEVKIPHLLNVFFKGNQSAIKSNTAIFYINDYGNHSPIYDVLFGGVMGNQRIGDALPLDYRMN